jgi:hypothetical protein
LLTLREKIATINSSKKAQGNSSLGSLFVGYPEKQSS